MIDPDTATLIEIIVLAVLSVAATVVAALVVIWSRRDD